tara:strand:+ start:8668 stop:9186 length:519 start_codon:yes stop_codon:yes gene_type:complete
MALTRISATSFAALAMTLSLAACGETADDTAVADTETEMAAAPADMDILKVRHDNFEGIGDAFKVIRGELEKGSPDFDAIQANARIIADNAVLIPEHFPECTGPADGADTEALDTIWEKPEEFSAATERMLGASRTMLAAADSRDAATVQAAVKELGGACKNCHDQFREKED